jgi:hypothetical protein
VANEETEIMKPTQKRTDDDLFKALCLGTLRDSDRIEGTPRNPRWKRDKKKKEKNK